MQHDPERYSCQLALPHFTENTQALLAKARVLVVGAGGLGCPTLQYLVSTGIGNIGIADYDVVSVSNLHRQILYNDEDKGKSKSILACQRLRKQNPAVNLIEYNYKITSHNIMGILEDYDLIVDCSDNFETRYLLNDAAYLKNIPLVYGAIYQYEGQVAVWNVDLGNKTRSPNYRDLFPSVDPDQIPNCSNGGVMPPIAGIIGCMQANEVIKYFTRSGDLLAGKLFIMDVLNCSSRVIGLGKTSRAIINSLEESDSINNVTIEQLNNFEAGNYRLIDVRTSAEHAAFNIGGENIPLQILDKYNFELDNVVILYCSTGVRSQAAAKLIMKNYPSIHVQILQGGIAQKK